VPREHLDTSRECTMLTSNPGSESAQRIQDDHMAKTMLRRPLALHQVDTVDLALPLYVLILLVYCC